MIYRQHLPGYTAEQITGSCAGVSSSSRNREACSLRRIYPDFRRRAFLDSIFIKAKHVPEQTFQILWGTMIQPTGPIRITQGIMTVLTNRFTVREIIGKTVVIHNMPDDFRSQPAGDSGMKIACGVIERVNNRLKIGRG